MDERSAHERLRRMTNDPAARGLLDDAAVLDGLVLTHDSIAEGIHYFPFDPPESVGWKLVAVNLSDLAAKGATPRGALLSLALNGDEAWEERFLDGVEACCSSYCLPLIGGDTIALPNDAPRVLGLTAVGSASSCTPSRAGGRPGDRLWLVGIVGDAAAGLKLLLDDPKASGLLVETYRRPVPQLAAGLALAPMATAMMDVSDGLLLDCQRLCSASRCGAEINLEALPLSRDFIAVVGGGLEGRMFAATGGDDYALLAALPPNIDPFTLHLPSGCSMTAIGSLVPGASPSLFDEGRPIPLPERLGHVHRPD